MNNTTSNSTFTMSQVDYDTFRIVRERIYKSYWAMESVYILFGTLLNLWLIVAIATSPEMRKRLRNQVLCMILICTVLKTTISGSLEMSLTLLWKTIEYYNCNMSSFVVYFRLVTEFYDSCLIIILLCVYLAQVIDYDPTPTLTPLTEKLGKIALLVVPCVLGIILIPTIGSHFKPVKIKYGGDTCLYVSRDNYLLFKSLDLLVPFAITSILLVVISVLYYRRFHRGFTSSQAMRTELIGRGRQIDKVYAYIIAVSIDLACRLPSTLSIIIIHSDFLVRYVFSWVSWMIIDARSILMPWGWLFLDDVRERIKVWRPWYRPAPGIDLRITYMKDENASEKQT